MNIQKNVLERSNNKKLKIDKLKLINKRYACLEEVGRGGVSIVYKGIDIYSEYYEKKSNIVIKIPNEELSKKIDIDAFVYAEYSFLKKLNCDNIVRVLDFGIDKKTNVPFLVLEYIEGKLLSEISLVDIPLKAKKQMFKILLKTLHYIHNKNIIHADISPSNIIIKDDYTPVIFDFGISQNINTENSFTLKYEKVKAFNPLYSPPELLLEKNSKPTIYSDFFSLGTIFYEIFERKPLFCNSSEELLSNPIIKREFIHTPFYFKIWLKKVLSVVPEKRSLNNNLFYYNLINF